MNRGNGYIPMMETWLVTAAAMMGLLVLDPASFAGTRRLPEPSLTVKRPLKAVPGQDGARTLGSIRRPQYRVEIDGRGRFVVDGPEGPTRTLEEADFNAFVDSLPPPGRAEITLVVPYRAFQIARWKLRAHAVNYEMEEPTGSPVPVITGKEPHR